MERWIQWQNAQNTPRAMAKGRFLEIPALRGSGLYRREALAAVAAADNCVDASDVDATAAAVAASSSQSSAAPYRDLWMINGKVADCADATDPLYARPERAPLRPSGWWPVDADFWQRWFTLGGGGAGLN